MLEESIQFFSASVICMLLVVGLWVNLEYLHETYALNTTSQCINNASRPKLDRGI